ncbi:MAG: 4Fe-4S cluster-binding domain-containing protein [Chloroflexi bacterium]|nr:4Fe-4S cluster-binding domain-containing protein [Chloroflexota bacterium]
MTSLAKRVRELSRDVIRTNHDGVHEYLITSDFGDSSVGSESGYLKPFFRIFTPAKPAKGRKLNSLYGNDFNQFKDTLMDYPTIVQYKLGKVGVLPWEHYNRLISLHLSRCPLDCWHCYIEECLKSHCKICMVQKHCDRTRKTDMGIKEGWFSSKQIIDGFVEQRDSDRDRGLWSNILRITGGEPFLAPQLLLEILSELKARRLDKEVFLWTETNLVPLVVQDADKPLVSDELLNELAGYDNFCVHPCFHGLNKLNFEEITGQDIENFDVLIGGLKRLLSSGIDIYPTFGSNLSSPKDVERFYGMISQLDEFLPLRFCLIEYDLDYKPVQWRRKNIANFAKKHEKVYDRFQNIETWDGLLRQNAGYGYSQIPRHLVPIHARR